MESVIICVPPYGASVGRRQMRDIWRHIFYFTFDCHKNTMFMWPCIQDLNYTHTFHHQLVAQCVYLLYNAPTYFGGTFWPSSRAEACSIVV